ncbi:MAG: hypothetical protein WC873_01025 [Candidatus Gracilibacteria bacterium]
MGSSEVQSEISDVSPKAPDGYRWLKPGVLIGGDESNGSPRVGYIVFPQGVTLEEASRAVAMANRGVKFDDRIEQIGDILCFRIILAFDRIMAERGSGVDALMADLHVAFEQVLADTQRAGVSDAS